MLEEVKVLLRTTAMAKPVGAITVNPFLNAFHIVGCSRRKQLSCFAELWPYNPLLG